MPEYKYITDERLHDGRVARISLNRPETRNAQNRGMLVELDDAFRRAEQDDTVAVIILAGNGKSFSAGHDMGSRVVADEELPGPNQHPTFQIDGGTAASHVERRTLQEWQYYFECNRRWRDIRKITIAQVHGNVISAGLMLMWACDLIVAAENTTFADIVATRLGMPGVEYLAHPWEFGPRKAKELLLTGDSIDAEEGYRLGMVSKIFPDDELAERTLAFAERIARRPAMARMLVKESINGAVDAMGFQESLKHSFYLHQLGHAHWTAMHDDKFPAAKPGPDIEDWQTAGPIRPSRRDDSCEPALPPTEHARIG
ncbi:enoyl-CoA hydratase [Gordonia rhizosphera]|uniref:Putative enoyl-CoA hydratase n=1 Tax=Gordonia rhizosphera NBRC 16068 TaxID=1108045 RepID=K6X0D1_9ACTN|nr:enoyl-CoA hydratase [Gordonia rhizosphera]GAB92259.1 putative enoyl-CoA hydratase [Gordonia rhizosphera NBRC 16068]